MTDITKITVGGTEFGIVGSPTQVEYSTNETIIGTDIDGSWVYQISFTFSMPSGNNNIDLYDVAGINGLKELRRADIVVIVNDESINLPYYNGEVYIGYSIDVYNNNLQLYNNWEQSYFRDAKATLIYTKEATPPPLLTPLVPYLNSDDGNIIKNAYFGSYLPYYVFKKTKNGTTESWVMKGNATNVGYIGYHFSNPVCVKKVLVKTRNESPGTRNPHTFIVQGSNDNSNWTQIGDICTITNNDVNITYIFNFYRNEDSYTYWRIFITSVYDTAFCGIATLQFYGSESE